MIPLVDLRAQYQSIKAEIDEAIDRVLESSQFILGEQVEAFEAAFSNYCGVRHAAAVNSGTSALHLALLAADVRPGDEVITVPYSFIATATAIRYVGATPVFVDIDPGTCLMDTTQLESAVTSRTRAIIPVHLYGLCADMDAVLETARRHALVVIEDAAQAHGARYKGRRAGCLGDLACFSFYPSKNLGAYGEGGAVLTDNEDYASRIRVLRDQGQSSKYHHEVLGYNYRLEGIQGAVLRVKLRHLDEWNAARRRHADEYRCLLAETGLRLLQEPAYESTPVWHIFPVFTPQRGELRGHLIAAGVHTGIHYGIPIHLQKAFADLGLRAGQFPHSERNSLEELSLPIYAELPREALLRIAGEVRRFDRQVATATL
jgi:dTDP-4-amino-4,6-dideoxygalactose transaminase